MKTYLATFYKVDPKTGKRKRIGAIEVSDALVTRELPLAAKAFRQAPLELRHADVLRLERI